MARAAVLAGLAAFVLLTGAQTFDQPRPRGSEVAREQGRLPREPTLPFEDGPRGCPRETLVRFAALDAWVSELPLGGFFSALVARELVGSCSPPFASPGWLLSTER